jgi:hypothetical protein
MEFFIRPLLSATTTAIIGACLVPTALARRTPSDRTEREAWARDMREREYNLRRLERDARKPHERREPPVSRHERYSSLLGRFISHSCRGLALKGLQVLGTGGVAGWLLYALNEQLTDAP